MTSHDISDRSNIPTTSQKGLIVSSHTSPRWGARIAAVVGVVALSAVGFGAPAFAADPEFGNIDPNASGSITIHKHEHQSGSGAAISGDPQAPGSTLPNPIAGVGFTAYQLTDFSVSDAADWTALSTVTVPADACAAPSLAGWSLDAGTDFPATNAAGVSTLTLSDETPGTAANERLGAYLICETTPPTDATDIAAPFVVTVPFPDNQAGAPTNSNGWLYNVHAYPKNGLAPTITKTVDAQTELGLGATASFEVVTTVPRIADGNQFTSYTVVDPMDPRLTPTAVESVTLGTTALVRDVDYTVVTDRNVLMVSFTQAGLTTLKASGGQSVTTVFSGTVSSIAPVASFGLDAGEIYNIAYLVTENEPGTTPPVTPETPPLAPGGPVNPNEPFDPNEPAVPSIPSPAVTQNWGDVKVFKYDAGNGSTAVNGAVFEVYEAATPYATTCTTDVSTVNVDPIEVDGATTFTSTNGLVLVPGLFVSDSSNAPVDNATRCYVLKETAAPAGFVTPTGAAALLAVQVEIGETTVTAGDLASYDGAIGNVKSDVPNLPLTGGQGQVVLMSLGAGLILIAGGAAFVARRRKEKQAQ